MWPDWAIYWTLGNFLKPLATINLPKSPTFLGNFCEVVKINHFSSEISFGQLLWTFGDFFLVTLQPRHILSFIFGLFKQTSSQFLQQIYMKKCQSSIRCWDSNPQPSMHESPTMTTRPGLPPTVVSFLSGHFRPQFHYFRHFEAMQLVEEWRYGMRTADRLY